MIPPYKLLNVYTLYLHWFQGIAVMGGDTDSPLPALWDMDSADYECDCPGPPPPVFRLPPPPRPPFLHEITDCSEAPLLDLDTCEMTVSIRLEFILLYCWFYFWFTTFRRFKFISSFSLSMF